MASTMESEVPTKTLNANRYATKKTIAQGMLDIALLTANASQLKYVLQVGPRHEFYSLMLGLISTSMVLQVLVGILFLIIGALNINKERDKRRADILNDVILIVVFFISVINVVIAGFGIDNISAGALSVYLARLSVEDEQQHQRAKALYLVAVGCIMLAMTADVIKMGFGLDPALPLNASLRYYEPPTP